MTDDMLGKRFAGSKEQADDGFIVTVRDVTTNHDYVVVWYSYHEVAAQSPCEISMFRKIYPHHVEDKT